MRAARLILAATVVGILAATGAAVDAAPATPAAGHCLGGIHTLGQGWQQLTPNFEHSPQRVQEAVAVPYVPDRVWATNGSDLVMTDDAGCHWIGFILPGPPGLGLPAPLGDVLQIPTTTTIDAIAAPSSASASVRAYAGLNDTTALGTAPRIAYYDGSQSFQTSNQGLPTSGRVTQLAASASTPTIAYAVIDSVSALSPNPGLYATNDGGQSWNLVNGNVQSATYRDIKVDPVVATTVYALTDHGLVVSLDGGRNFASAGAPAGAVTSYDVASGGGSSRLVQGHSDRATFDRSDDVGRSWHSESAPVTAATVAMQPLIDQVAVSAGAGKPMFLRLAPVPGCPRLRQVTPPGGAPTTVQLTAPSAAGFAAVGIRGGQILRGTFSLSSCGAAVLGNGSAPIRLLPGAAHQYFPATLLPATRQVSLPAGGQRDVPYRLLLPRSPSPIDVMFLIDTSASTQDTINGLKQDLKQIVDDLNASGLDVEFGLGDFKDYPPKIDDRGAGESGDYPYRLDRAVGPSGPALAAALTGLHARGGGDPPESQLTALYQSTTGAGQRWPGPHPPQTWIPGLQPGGAAGYRPDALKLAVLATDDRFHRARKYLTPSWDSTVAAVRTHGVHFIGLAIRKTSDGQVFGYRSFGPEQQFATDSGSFAPAGGVDCNGDLIPDVRAGAPFVCKVNAIIDHAVNVGPLQSTDAKVEPVKLAPAITTAAQSIADVRPVGLQVSGGPPGLAAVIAPTATPQVNLKADNTLSFTVQYNCPRADKRHVYDLRADATAAGRVVASAPLKLSCAPVPPKPKAPRAPVAAAAAPLVAVRPPQPPAPPPPAPGNPVPNTNPNPNPALNPNVGFASQEEEQRQLAFAGADMGAAENTGEELAMSRLELGAGVLMAAAAGWAVRRRLADRPAYAPVWHSRR